jgi:hypothetical protein
MQQSALGAVGEPEGVGGVADVAKEAVQVLADTRVWRRSRLARWIR